MGLLDIYRDTVTIFNRHGDEDNLVWTPTILFNCHFIVDKSAIISSYGEQSQDNAILHVLYKNVNGVPKINGKTYVLPKEYARSSNFSSEVTFSAGKNFDFVYGGGYGSTTPINDSSYTKGFFDYMNKNYDLVFAITGCSMYKLIPHFEITAR